MEPEEALRKAKAAERIFNDPIVKETLDMMDAEIMAAWKQCPIRDLEAREALWRMAVTTGKFRDLLRGTMESGKLALDQIRRKESAMDKVRNVANRFSRS